MSQPLLAGGSQQGSYDAMNSNVDEEETKIIQHISMHEEVKHIDIDNDRLAEHLADTLDKEHINKLILLFNKKQYYENDLRDELCEAFGQEDQHLIIYKILFDELDLGRDKRQQIYDVLIHKYFEVAHLTVDNMIN
eukprot:303563_1